MRRLLRRVAQAMHTTSRHTCQLGAFCCNVRQPDRGVAQHGAQTALREVHFTSIKLAAGALPHKQQAGGCDQQVLKLTLWQGCSSESLLISTATSKRRQGNKHRVHDCLNVWDGMMLGVCPALQCQTGW